MGNQPSTLFINTNNNIIVANRDNAQILIWANGSSTLTTAFPAGLVNPQSLFMTSVNEIYIGNDATCDQVDRWTFNGTQLPSPLSIPSQCYGLFIDINNNLYCSQGERHQVTSRSLSNPANTFSIVAGTSCPGSAPHMLNSPHGIFVAMSMDLYVADCLNSRIQLFRSGQVNGTAVAGSGSVGTIALTGPTGVMLDGDGYLFIVDRSSHRIVAEDAYGFRCVVGCLGGPGSASDQLSSPATLSFDTDGNMFISDRDNHRIQKFSLANNSCSK